MTDLTCWTLIRDAAGGAESAREEFARRYLPVVQACLRALGSARVDPADLDDAAGEVLLECFKQQGLLERAEPGRGSGFRALLFAACRNVLLRQRTRHARRREHAADEVGDVCDSEETLGHAFDRAWAVELLREAGEHHLRAAQGHGLEAVRRAEILRLRFHEGLEVRRISALLGLPSDFVHHEYAQARNEFRRSLQAVIAEHNPDSPEDAARELRDLLGLYTPHAGGAS